MPPAKTPGPESKRAALARSVRARKKTILIVAVVGALIAPFFAPVWAYGGPVRITIEWIGLTLLLVCVAGRTWCSLYIGDHKVSRLVVTGPYSVCRNPLYAFSTIGAVGVGATFGMLSAAVLDGGLALALLAATLGREEAVLESVHGEAYRAYLTRVPRFWPRLSEWRDAATLEVSPATLRRAFADSLIFLVAIPVARICESLQVSGLIHPLAYLP